MAVVKPDNTVEFRKVTVGRDYGQTAEVTDGVSPGDLIVTNPGERLRDGLAVQPKLHSNTSSNGQENASNQPTGAGQPGQVGK